MRVYAKFSNVIFRRFWVLSIFMFFLKNPLVKVQHIKFNMPATRKRQNGFLTLRNPLDEQKSMAHDFSGYFQYFFDEIFYLQREKWRKNLNQTVFFFSENEIKMSKIVKKFLQFPHRPAPATAGRALRCWAHCAAGWAAGWTWSGPTAAAASGSGCSAAPGRRPAAASPSTSSARGRKS